MLLPGKQGLRGYAVTQAAPAHLIWDGFNRFPGRRHLAAGGGGVDGGGGCARHKAQAQQERDTASHGCGLALHAGAGQVGDVRRGGGRSKQVPGTGAGYPLWAGHPAAPRARSRLCRATRCWPRGAHRGMWLAESNYPTRNRPCALPTPKPCACARLWPGSTAANGKCALFGCATG
jgi:hypothetical protein